MRSELADFAGGTLTTSSNASVDASSRFDRLAVST